MSNHLSQDQFARCNLEPPAGAELQHLMECPECSAELERFGTAVLQFRTAIQDRIEDRIALQASEVTRFAIRPAEARSVKWSLALGAAVVVLGMLPFLAIESQPRKTTNADELMNAVNLHLSRIVPAPMEPMMSLLPNQEFKTESGGVQ